MTKCCQKHCHTGREERQEEQCEMKWMEEKGRMVKRDTKGALDASLSSALSTYAGCQEMSGIRQSRRWRYVLYGCVHTKSDTATTTHLSHSVSMGTPCRTAATVIDATFAAQHRARLNFLVTTALVTQLLITCLGDLTPTQLRHHTVGSVKANQKPGYKEEWHFTRKGSTKWHSTRWSHLWQ